jgi:hypothetical protein
MTSPQASAIAALYEAFPCLDDPSVVASVRSLLLGAVENRDGFAIHDGDVRG